MINFELRNMPDFFFGKGMERKCGELLREFGGSRVLIHHSGEAFVRPLIELLKEDIERAGLTTIELGGVVPNPRLSKIYEGIELGKREKIDCVLAVGGGSVIDSAKGIAMGCAYDGDVWDFYCQKAVPERMLVLGVVSTFAGTGSESSRASVVTNDKTQLKRSADDFDLMRPDFAILNPELTQSIPPFQTASGAADIFSHLCENYFSATKDIYLSRQLLTAGMKTVMKNAPTAVREPDNYAARSALMMTAPLAVNGIMRLGLVGDWACHLIEHEMSTEWDIPHGAGLAVITPCWMEYVYKRDVELFARFAVEAFNCEYDFDNPEWTAREGIRKVRGFFRDLGLPGRIQEFAGEVSSGTLKKLAARIPYDKNGDKWEIGCTFHLEEKDVYEIYKMAL